MIIANMGTYPARRQVIIEALNTLLPQVDVLNLCLNNYDVIPNELIGIEKLNCFIPTEDYRDVGKFVVNGFNENDDIFYVDDDILYPADYVERMMKYRESIKHLHPIIGLHGVIYPDVYDGHVQSRVVFTFNKEQKKSRVVNQLGTGTVYCKGYQAASFDFMNGSQKFVDVRFAVHARNNNWPMISISRAGNWLREVKTEETIFSTFTGCWPLDVIKECQLISGYKNICYFVLNEVEINLGG